MLTKTSTLSETLYKVVEGEDYSSKIRLSPEILIRHITNMVMLRSQKERVSEKTLLIFEWETR